MSVSVPKKKKIFILIRGLSDQANTYIDSHSDGGAYEQGVKLMPALEPQMDISGDENDWTSEQQAAYDAAETLSDYLASGILVYSRVESYVDSLRDAISNL